MTTEKTSKRLKLHMLLAMFVCIAGAILMAGQFNLPVGFLILAAGLLWFIAARIGFWWKHG